MFLLRFFSSQQAFHSSQCLKNYCLTYLSECILQGLMKLLSSFHFKWWWLFYRIRNEHEPKPIHIWYVRVFASLDSELSLFSTSHFAIMQSSSYKIGSIFPMRTGTGPSGVRTCVTCLLNGFWVVSFLIRVP